MPQAPKRIKAGTDSYRPGNALADLLARYRKASGLSAQDLAGRIPFETAENLLKYEAGQASPPLDSIMALSNELNIPPGEILQLVFGLYERKN